jgi:WD40 repeat protein/serine/threonine protein kinase
VRDEKQPTSGRLPPVTPPTGVTALTVDDHPDVAIACDADGVSPADEPLPPLTSRVLGDFVLGEVVGAGGFGTVYRAEQRSLERPAVVKVVHRSLAARPQAAERFTREARLASRFNHPYAAHVYSFGVEPDGVMWIAMELIDGTPLSRLIRKSGPLALDRFVPLFERLCEVVQSAHDQGIVHRDIKPSNVMVIVRAGRLMPKLLDFGMAKLVGADTFGAAPLGPWPALEPGSAARPSSGVSRSLTRDDQVLGSPMYMAPEQWYDPATAGPLADQYALALVAYEALTGEHAFTGTTLEALAHQHRNAALPVLPGHLPAALHAALSRACDKLPERRFANPTELAAAIRFATLGATSELEESSASLPEDVSPYPGLAAYTGAERALFVGRERDLEELIDRLDTQPIITVVGPSGSGKTSFLAAGLAPAVPAGLPAWRTELIRPGGDPPGALWAIVAQHAGSGPRKAPRDGAAIAPAALAAGLMGVAAARGVVLVVIVDQAEELFTMCTEQASRLAFAEALVMASSSRRVRVVLALRDDFLCRIEQLPAWRGLLGRAVHVLGVPRRDDLERMLTVPARRCGFGFDDPALPREIVDQVAVRPGALPLVAFTAAQLWEHRDRRSRRLTRAAYQQIGGVIGALVQHADTVVDRMSVPDRRQVRLLFRRLITAEGARALISRTELESALGGASAGAVIDRLLAARLIVSRDDDTGDRIEIIHETLATTWPRLAAWRREDADGAQLRERLAAAARHWDQRARASDLLWRGDALSDLRRWQDRGDTNLTPVEQAFVRACITSAVRVRRTRIALVVAAFALLIAGILGLVSANRKIADQRATAVDRLRASFEERGRLAIADGDDAHGMLYLAEASRLGARGPGFDLLTTQAVASLDAGLEVVAHGSSGIAAMETSPTGFVTLGWDLTLSRWDRAGKETRVADGMYYATVIGDLAVSVSTEGDLVATDARGSVRWTARHAVADPETRSGGVAASTAAHLVVAYGRTATLWDPDTGQARGELAHDRGVTAVVVTGDGTRIATGDSAGVVRIWNTSNLQRIATCEPHTGVIRVLRFSPDGGSVVSGGNDGVVMICDTTSGATLHRLVGHSRQVVAVDITGDGKTIVSAGRDGKPRIWDAQTGLLIRVLEGHHGAVTGAQFSPDGNAILSFGLDGTARIWSREGMALGSLQGHGAPIYAGRWDGDGHHVVTTSVDGAIRRWDPAQAIKTAFRQAHGEAVTDLAISDDDRWVLTASSDGHARLWERRSLQPITELPHGAKVTSARFGPGARALTTDEAGAVRIWQLPEGKLIASLGPGIAAAAYAHDGRIVTATGGSVALWSPTGARLDTVAVGYEVRRLSFDPTGRWLFVQGTASSVAVIDSAAFTPVVRLAVRDHHVLALAASASRVAITDGPAIRLWQLGSWLPLGTLAGHKSPVADVWFASDERLVSAGADGTLVWGFSPLRSEKLGDTNRVLALATSPDGALFATTAADGATRIWGATSYRLLLQLPGHSLPAFALQFTHDGATAISGGNDGRLVTWDLTRRTRSSSELAEIVRCRVPLRLEGDVALPRDLDFDDPACRSLMLDR